MKYLLAVVVTLMIVAQTQARFQYYDIKLSWGYAVRYCEARGGKLASADDADEFIEMRDLAVSHNDDRVWIDSDDRHDEGHWICRSQPGDDCKVLWWDIGSPNNGGGDEDCACLQRNKDYLVNDTECHRRERFICKF